MAIFILLLFLTISRGQFGNKIEFHWIATPCSMRKHQIFIQIYHLFFPVWTLIFVYTKIVNCNCFFFKHTSVFNLLLLLVNLDIRVNVSVTSHCLVILFAYYLASYNPQFFFFFKLNVYLYTYQTSPSFRKF